MFDFIKNIFSKAEEEEDLLTKLPDSVVLLNNQGSFLWYNDIAQKTLTDIKENFAEGYIDDILENAMDLIVKIADTDKPSMFRTKSSLEKDMFFELSARKTLDGYLVIMRNNTQSYKKLISILVEHESSEKVNRDKNNFLVKISDKLKTPLQSIVGFSQAILDGLGGEVSEKQKKYVTIINKNSEETLYLFNKILDLSKSESNLFEKKLSYFDAINVLNSVLKANEKEINEKRLNITLNISPEIKRTIYSDEAFLKLILRNIIESAIQSTDVGDITIDVKHPDLEYVNEKGLIPFENASEKSFLMFEINDMSLGISEQDLEVLFEPYAQLDNPNKKVLMRSVSFATIKNIIKLLKGNMWVESEAMQGTTYNIIIPVEKVIQVNE